MELREAIDKRCSRRVYKEIALEEKLRQRLQESVQKYNKESGLHIQLITGNGDAFKGFRKSYGLFSGVYNYFAMVGPSKDRNLKEKIGYYGEKLVLEATEYGLGTCWVGGTYDRKSCSCEISDNEEMPCVITVGYTAPELTGKEKFLAGVMHRHTKTAEDMIRCEEKAPQWVNDGMAAVVKAPSAVHKQPVRFLYRNGIVMAMLENEKGSSMVDLGIAKLHFELGAGKGSWEYGNKGFFDYNKE